LVGATCGGCRRVKACDVGEQARECVGVEAWLGVSLQPAAVGEVEQERAARGGCFHQDGHDGFAKFIGQREFSGDLTGGVAFVGKNSAVMAASLRAAAISSLKPSSLAMRASYQTERPRSSRRRAMAATISRSPGHS